MARIFRRGKAYWGRAQRKGREYRRSLGTTDRAIAERRFRTWLDELDSVAWGEKPRRSYAEAEEKFIREHLTTLKPNAAKRYGVSLKHLSANFGRLGLEQITTATLSEFETLRRTAGVSPSTIRRDFACLSSLLTSCVDWEWLEVNIVPSYLRKRRKRGLKEGEARTRYLTDNEETALLKAATPAVRDAITLAIDTGLRREEMFSLRWDQIDLGRGMISTTTNTKSGRVRKVPLPERSRLIVEKMPKVDGNPFVLINPKTGERYVQQNKGLKAAMGRAGISDLQWHDLRRTAGCRWLQRDRRSMAEVSVLLGHSSIQITEKRYAFLESEQIAESISNRTLVGTSA